MVTHGLLFPHKQDVLSLFSYPLYFGYLQVHARSFASVSSVRLLFFSTCTTGRAEESLLKYESDCLHRNKYLHMVEGFARLFSLFFFIHPPKHSFSGTSFHSRCLHIENCKRPRRNQKAHSFFGYGFLFPPNVFSFPLLYMKKSNIHVGTIHRNVRISN